MADVTQSIDVRIKTAIDSANAETSLKSLRGALKDLQSLAEEAADGNTAAFEQLEIAINRVEGRIGDASDRLRVMAGEPLERVRNGVSLFGEGIKNLDFTKATIGIDGLASGIKNMNVGDFSKGIQDVTGSFVNLGKALISNPIFLLTTVITAIITNFDKLVNAGGLVGKVFSAIGVIVTSLKDALMSFVNALGIVNTKQEQLRQNTSSLTEAQNNLNIAYLKGAEAIAAASGQSALYYEYEEKKLEVQNKLVVAQREFYDEIKKRPNLEKIFNQETLASANDFAKKYNLILSKDQLGALEAYYAAKQDLEQTTQKNAAQLSREDIERTHKYNVDRINTIKDQNKKEIQLEQEDFRYNSELRKIERYKNINDISAQNVAEFEMTESQLKLITTKKLEAQRDLNAQEDILNEARKSNASRLFIEAQEKAVNAAKDKYNALAQEEKNGQDYLSKIAENHETKYKDIKNKGNENQKNARKKHRQELSEIDLKFDLENIKNSQDTAKGILDYNLKYTDKLHNQAIISLRDAELNKQVLMDEYRKEEIKRITDSYDKQIKLATGNAEKIKFLQAQKKLALDNLQLDQENFIKESNERILKNDEAIAKERERIAKEQLETKKSILDAEIQSAQSATQHTQTQISTLDEVMRYEKKGIEDMFGFRSDYANRKKDLIMEDYANQGIELQKQMAAELLANETNTVNKEQREFEIKQEYADKEIQLRANTSQAVREINVAEFERKAQLWKDYIDFAVNMDSFIRDIQRIGLSETKKEEEKSARQRFVIQKIAGALTVGIDTTIGVMKAVSLNPLTGGLPQSAFIAAAGAANIAAILAKQFTYSGGGGSVAGSSGISATAPNVGAPPTLNTSSMYNPSAFYGIGTQRTEESTYPKSGLRAYVVETDITSTQKKVQVLSERATLTGR